MSTLRPSNTRVVLLWGDRWWIEDQSEPLVFGDIARAAETLLAHVAPAARPIRLRLIYQPDALAAESVACPQGNRATLKLALGDAYPALASEGRAWGFEPIVGGCDRFATLLYHETQPVLYSLVERLRAGGIEIESAWPLPSLLNFVPEDWPETGALTVVAVATNQTLVFRHTPEGRRVVEAAAGAAAQVLASVTVRDTLARHDTALYLATLDDTGDRIAVQLPALDVPRVRLVRWPRMIVAARTLSRRHPAQLLPLPPVFSAHRLLLAASAAVALAACGLAADYVRTAITRRDADKTKAVEVATLRAEIARRHAARVEFDALRRAVQAGEPAPPVFAPWLRSLGRQLPPSLVLTALRAERSGFTLAGGATTPTTEAAWRNWLAAVAPATGQWQLAEPASVPSADFRLVARSRP